MIPEQALLAQEEFEIDIYPSKTYRMDIEKGRVIGMVDGIESMPQAIYKILNTERFDYTGYSMNYGVELSDLYGESINYVLSEIKVRITEALMWDSRIISVDNFEFEISRHQIHCTFTVRTIHGELAAERIVEI